MPAHGTVREGMRPELFHSRVWGIDASHERYPASSKPRKAVRAVLHPAKQTRREMPCRHNIRVPESTASLDLKACEYFNLEHDQDRETPAPSRATRYQITNQYALVLSWPVDSIWSSIIVRAMGSVGLLTLVHIPDSASFGNPCDALVKLLIRLG